MGFKDRLKELRMKKGITQETLAASLDIPESTIRRLESSDEGLPRRERLEKIADFFGVTVDYLLGRDSNQNSTNDLSELLNDPDISPEDKELLKQIQYLPADKKRLVKELLAAFGNELEK